MIIQNIFEIGYIKSGLSYNNNIIPIGTNYRSVNLKDINVPKKKEIDLSKMISSADMCGRVILEKRLPAKK